MRRYRKRWKVERTLVWLGKFRRLVVHYEKHSLMYQAIFRITCLLITLGTYATTSTMFVLDSMIKMNNPIEDWALK